MVFFCPRLENAINVGRLAIFHLNVEMFTLSMRVKVKKFCARKFSQKKKKEKFKVFS